MSSKKRTKSKTGTRRRRRVSGVAKMDFMQPILAIAGAVAGGVISNLDIVKKTLTIGGKDYTGMAVLGAGIFLKASVKDPMVKSAADGLIVTGGIKTVQVLVPSLHIGGIMGIDQIGMLDMSRAPRMLGVGAVGAIDEIGAVRSKRVF